MDNENKTPFDEETTSESVEQDTPLTSSVEEAKPSKEPTDSITLSDAPEVKIKKENKFLSFLKSWKGISLIAAIIIIAGISIFFVNKANRERDYEKNLKEFVIESGKASMGAAYICDDLRQVWQQYIFDDKKYFNPTTGQISSWNGSVYCSDFSEAVNRKIRWNEEHTGEFLNEPYRKAQRLYRDMTPAPDKYKEIHVYVKQMFKAMERLHSLSTNPTGNLSSYSRACNEAVEEYTSALSDLSNESDIDFSKIESDEED